MPASALPDNFPEFHVDSAQAEALLPKKKRRIHTFQRSLGWQGCDMDRTKIVSLIHEQRGASVSSDAAHFDHLLVVEVFGRRTYIETDGAACAQLLDGRAAVASADDPPAKTTRSTA